VRALGNAFGRTPFLACEAWEAALQEGELRAVMSELAINGPKSLGHRLRRLEVESAGIGRGSRDHNSVLWVVL
jgi:hypothetical protein